MSEAQRQAALRRWNDPIKRAKWLAANAAALDRIMSDPELRAKRSEKSIKKRQSPEGREKNRQAAIRQFASTEVRQESSQRAKLQFADPEKKERHRSATVLSNNDPEKKRCHSEYKKAWWAAHPEKRKEQSTRQILIWQDKEKRAEMCQHQSDCWSDPDYRAYRESFKDEQYTKASETMKQKFDSPEFRQHHLESRPRGEDHYLYDQNKQLDYNRDFRAKAKKIRRRDLYTCALCYDVWNKGGRTFIVHHIDGNKLNDDPLNLVTLCPSCHIRTHAKAGWMETMSIVLRDMLRVESYSSQVVIA